MGLEDVRIRNRQHKANRAVWLRASVLGVNDGLVSTASLMVGVAAASASFDNAKAIIISTGAAGIAAGALSMAVGEYISVASQTDIEESDRLLEIEHLRIDPEGELEELVEIYKERGLDEPLARQVAAQLTERDALNTHLRDELGHHPHSKARPLQASIASALSLPCQPYALTRAYARRYGHFKGATADSDFLFAAGIGSFQRNGQTDAAACRRLTGLIALRPAE